jgi:hypothetical protein
MKHTTKFLAFAACVGIFACNSNGSEKDVMESAINQNKQSNIPMTVPDTTAPENWTKVLLETDYGNITIALNPATPKHTENFIKLVKEKYYDGVLFHRIIPGFMIGYFINARPVFDHSLTIINYELFKSDDFLDKIKHFHFFNIFNINMKTTIDCETIHPILLLIATIIINNIKTPNEKLQTVFDYVINKYTEKSRGLDQKSLVLGTNRNFNQMINEYIRKNINKSMYDLRINRLDPKYVFDPNDLDNIRIVAGDVLYKSIILDA